MPIRLKNVSTNCFKKTITTKIIEILETETSYADIDTLINKMEKNFQPKLSIVCSFPLYL